MLTTILITAAVAAPVGYLVGAMVAGSKVIDAERRADAFHKRAETALARLSEVSQERDQYKTALDRLTDRDERGRFVRREIDNGARPKEGRFKL